MEKKFRRGIFITLISICGIMAALALYLYKDYGTSNFLPGAYIGVVAVQGQSMEEAAELLNAEVEQIYNTPVRFYKDDYSKQIQLGDICEPLNLKEQVQGIWNKEKDEKSASKLAALSGNNKRIYPLELNYKEDIMKQLAEEWNSQWEIAAQNAELVLDQEKGLVINGGKSGMRVDEKATFAALPRDLVSGEEINIPILFEDIKAELGSDMLKNMGELSSFSSCFNAGDINRSNNLYTASSKINAYLLEPQQIFSFNGTVGIRSKENGYRSAMVIVGDDFEPGLGGGVCQVSSTLYNACLMAGLEIVERFNHALAVSYVPLGQDATVYYGVQDFKFKNNTSSPIYLQVYAEGGKLTVKIYGNLQDKKEVKVYHVVDRLIEYKTVSRLDESLNQGEEKIKHEGYPGYIVRSFREFYDNQGQLERSEQLARDVYRPLNKLILTGPQLPVVENPDQSTGNQEEPDSTSDGETINTGDNASEIRDDNQDNIDITGDGSTDSMEDIIGPVDNSDETLENDTENNQDNSQNTAPDDDTANDAVDDVITTVDTGENIENDNQTNEEIDPVQTGAQEGTELIDETEQGIQP